MFKKMLSALLAVAMLLSMAACAGTDTPASTSSKPNTSSSTKPSPEPGGSTTIPVLTEDDIVKFEGDFIYKDAVSVIPANWNPHTYRTSDEAYPLDWISSSLYEFMYNDVLHPVEGKDDFTGYKIVPSMAASDPVDVTEQIAKDHPEFGIPEGMTKGYAYTIDLNPDVKFDNGKPINAETYVEGMKRLLAPGVNNYRSEVVRTGDFILANAENYQFQGTSQMVDDASVTIDNMVKAEDGSYNTKDGDPIYIAVNYVIKYFDPNTLADYVNAYGEAYFSTTHWDSLVAKCDEDGLVRLTEETLPWILDVFTGNPAWGEDESYLGNYLVYNHIYKDNYGFENVGLFASGEYQITVVLQNSLSGFNLYYNIGSLTLCLVDVELYDACLTEKDGVYTSTYCTSVETTVGYGPYKLVDYQLDKSMRFVRNESWYGYSDGKHIYQDPTDGLYYNMYQTTEIQAQQVKESSTQKLMFLKGQLMGYGLQAEDFEQYRSSEFVYATPATTIFFLILNGHMEAITNRENAADFNKDTTDLETMTLLSFRKAMAVAIDKENFAATISPARSGAYSIIGNLYVYDVDTGARYRDTDQAKQILCDFYSVDVSQYDSLDDAVKSITGFDAVAAKRLFGEAYAEALEKGYITDKDNDGISDQTVTITYASSGSSDFMTRTLNYLNEKINECTKGTGLEGKIKIVESAAAPNDWDTKLKEGTYDTCLAGWQGSALNPFSLTDLYTNPEKQYDGKWFDSTSVNLTLTVNVGGVDKKDMQEITMNLKQWSDALNGTAVEIDGKNYNFGDGQTDIDTRLTILAGIEGEILKTYNYLPMLQNASMALLSKQVYYVVEEYSPITGRGGVAYMKYNYNEAEWAAYIEECGGELTY